MKHQPDTTDAQSLLLGNGGNLEQAITEVRAVYMQSIKSNEKVHNSAGRVLVSVEDISKDYRLGHERIEALRHVSFKVYEGEFVAITGASGSGKSTLLQLIGGLDRPNSGVIRIAGQDVTKLRDSQLSIFRNQTVGFVFQFFYLQPFLDLETNMGVPGMFARVKRRVRRERAAELAKAVGIEDRLRHLPKELSGGQMQRAAIARALFNRPKLLLADEPTGNLDSKNSMAIIALFESIRKQYGTTVIVVTHDPQVASRADRVIIVKDGGIAA